jgi:hypothetical protein
MTSEGTVQGNLNYCYHAHVPMRVFDSTTFPLETLFCPECEGSLAEYVGQLPHSVAVISYGEAKSKISKVRRGPINLMWGQW